MKVLVVGGGLVGACVAYRLLCRGAEVTLADPEEPGRASAAGAGMLPALDHFTAAPAVLPLLREARRYYSDLLAQLAGDGETDTGYERVGALHLAFDAAELEALEEQRQRARSLEGFAHVGQVTRVTADEARRMLPALGRHLMGALHASGAARVDGRKLLACLRRAIARRGGRLSAERIVLVRRGAKVLVGGPPREAGVSSIVVCAGAWSGELARSIGIRLPVTPQRGQLLHLQVAGEATRRWPLAIRSPTNYLLGFAGGRVVVGATREEVDGFDEHGTTHEGLARVRTQSLAMAPRLALAATLEARVGFRPVTPDGLPLLGPIRGLEGLWFATGHGGYGIEVGPYSGALVADQILGDEAPFPLAPYAPQRFSTTLES